MIGDGSMNIIIEFNGMIKCKDVDIPDEEIKQIDTAKVEEMLKEDIKKYVVGYDDELSLSVTSIEKE